MYPSRFTLRFVVPVLLVSLLVCPALAQDRGGPVPLPEGGWQPPPSYSEQQRRQPATGRTTSHPPQAPLSQALSPSEMQRILNAYAMPIIKNDGTRCLGNDYLIMCPEPWLQTERTSRADSEFYDGTGWHCSSTGRHCATSSEGQGCGCGMLQGRRASEWRIVRGSSNPVALCVPRGISAVVAEFIRLYEQLHAFKDDAQFAEVGFALGFPYSRWLERVESLQKAPQQVQLDFLYEMDFYIGDLFEIGWVYMGLAARGTIDRESRRYLRNMERTIREGIAQARCE